jgi:sterol desaturase/sphingolipid hydroxylase (fatty acid hydroxylase superfamily)
VSWASTFTRFHPGRIPLVGPIVLRVADWSRPQPGYAPMFDYPPLFERLSVVHPLVPTIVYLPAGIWLIARGARAGFGAEALVACYLAGLLAWSLLEYGAHRGSFHHEPTSRWQVAYAYLVHGVHHAYPDDSRRWMMPLVVTIPIALVLYGLAALLLGEYAAPVFAGFLHGYLTYDLLHYFIHRGRLPTRVGRYLRQYHLVHHFKTPDRHFGVSSPLWDVVFRTR